MFLSIRNNCIFTVNNIEIIMWKICQVALPTSLYYCWCAAWSCLRKGYTGNMPCNTLKVLKWEISEVRLKQIECSVARCHSDNAAKCIRPFSNQGYSMLRLAISLRLCTATIEGLSHENQGWQKTRFFFGFNQTPWFLLNKQKNILYDKIALFAYFVVAFYLQEIYSAFYFVNI